MATFRSIVKLLFTIAGLYWLFIYGFAAADLITHEEMATLRSGQTLVYFVLLSLWGIDYMREAKMLRRVLNSGADASTATYPVLAGLPGNAASWMMPVLNIIGLTVSAVLIGRQYSAMISVAFD